MNRRRPYPSDSSDRGGFRNKRPRFSEPELTPEEKLEFNIVNLGENDAVDVNANLDGLSAECEDALTDNKLLILNTICECIAELPEKTSLYSTLVGLINAKNYNFGGEVVESLVKNFKDYLKASEWTKARSLVRLFGDLVNSRVISAGSLLNLFESLTDVTMEDNIPQARSDFFIFSVLSALPWIGLELSEKKEQELEQLLNTIESYIGKRSKAHHNALRVWYSDTPHPQEEYLDCLWAQIVKLRSDKWVDRHISRPHLNFETALSEALQHNLPQIVVPPHDASTVYPYPKVVFRFFDYTDCPEGPVLPGAHSIERFLIEDSLRETITQRYYDRKDCASALVKYPGRHKLPIDYMMVEVIFGELFTLPTSNQLEIFYGSLFLELCKLQPSTMPQVLAQSVELLFERLETMNGACIDRVSAWFAYHLSNFQFRWSWEDWSACLTMDPLHPKPKFVRETLIRCMRLSYHPRISESVPESFQPLLPELPQPKDVYEDISEGIAESELEIAKKLKEQIMSKTPVDEVMDYLTKLPNESTIDELSSSQISLQMNVFSTTILNLASKSFTHLFAAIGKFQKVFKTLCATDEGQLRLLHSIFQVWKTHQQLMVVLVDKLVKADILENTNVVSWIFSSEMSEEITKSYVWEILFAVINRKVRSIAHYQEDIDKKRDELFKFEGGGDGVNVVCDDENEIPSEAKIERMEETLENYLTDLKNLLIVVFQRFVQLLSEHIQNCEAQNKTFKNYWFRWTIGRLQQVFFDHHNHIFNVLPTLESLIFSADLDQHILLIFKQFRSLRA